MNDPTLIIDCSKTTKLFTHNHFSHTTISIFYYEYIRDYIKNETIIKNIFIYKIAISCASD